MKTINYAKIISLLTTLLLFHLACPVQAKGEVPHTLAVKFASDSLLNNAQQKIDNAFIQSIQTKTPGPLQKIQNALEQGYAQRQLNLIQYWRGYLQFYLAIYHLKSGAKDLAEKETDRGIALLKVMERKNSEDYALLALMEGFSIQFKGMKVIVISQKMQEHGQLALSMDSTNLRAHYVLGNHDFYTPKAFGGGKKVEKYLKKAVSLPAQTVPNPFLPSWGKEESYELLIRHYIGEEKWAAAKKYHRLGMEEFPNSYLLTALSKKLEGK